MPWTFLKRPNFLFFSQEGQSMEVESSEIVAMPTINWGHIADLLHPMSRSLTKILNYIKDNYQFKVS